MKEFAFWLGAFAMLVLAMCVGGQVGQWRAEDAARATRHWEGNIVTVTYSGQYSDRTVLTITGDFDADAHASGVFVVKCDGELRHVLKPGDRITGAWDREGNRIFKGVVGGIPSDRWGGKKP